MALKDIIANLKKPQRQKDYAQLLDGYIPVFSQFGENIYASDIVQMCIDIIATECSKLKPKHIRYDGEDKQTIVKGSLNRLFRISPNEMMTTKDFLEKIIWLLYMNYNAFVYPTYDIITDTQGRQTRNYTGLYPLNPVQVDFMQNEEGRIFVRMVFLGGNEFTLPYSNLIHLRKKFSVSEVMGGGRDGQPNNDALLKVLEINDTVLQGVGQAIKTSLAIRGILNIKTMLDDDKQQAERARFEKAIATGTSGILAMDLKSDYIPITVDPKLIDKDTLEFLQNKVLNYYGVSVPILSGDFNDQQYQAFYEKTLEPLIISLGQAFSKALFTIGELDHGNEIEFYPQKLLFTNTAQKVNVADILGNRGALTNNALLDLFGYPPYDGGETRYMSLNYVDVNIANEYQMTRAKTSPIGLVPDSTTKEEPKKGDKKDGQDDKTEPTGE